VLVAWLALGACSRQILIDSEPRGALVRLNGQVRGTTPFRTSVDYTAFSRYEIVLEREGYRTATAKLPMELDAGSLICGTVCWPFLLVVQRPSHTVFVLEPLRPDDPPPENLVAPEPGPSPAATPDVTTGATAR
jgi:hypothetical protein